VIAGTGVDLCEVARMEKAIAAPHGRRFIERVFTPGEIAYADGRGNRCERYAARFAAKEAAMKALGTGWGKGVTWQDFEVVNLPSGQPVLQLRGAAAEIAGKLGVARIALSLAHTREHAIAMVILESL
jgi:holo-[acyl-carrier protein] synthase